MPQYGQAVYNEEAYNTGSDNIDFFLARLVESLPPPYRPEDFEGFNVRGFLGRILRPSAEDLDSVNATIDRLHELIAPESAPEDWLRWILTEWFGWTLIPDGFPVNPVVEGGPCLRRLLANLHLHYKRRYTVTGIRELLREFGIIAEVYDRPLFVGGFLGSYGVARHPLHVRIRVLSVEPFYFPRRVYVGGFIGGGGTYLYQTQQIITESFIRDLVHWSRPAGVEDMIEIVTGSYSIIDDEPMPDDDEIIAA
ncbi:MAG: hypothetical protein AB1631_15800 [Acidobacteriota bacterium]